MRAMDPPRNARAQALDLIRQKIITMELPPGAHLSENDLAGQVGLSRTPVRESLILLAEERLVVIVPQVGTLVSPIVESEIATAQFVRESLEVAALRDSVGRATPAQLRELNALTDAQRAADARGDTEEFFVLDEQFHAALMEISGHGSAWRTVGQAKAHLDRARRLSLAQVSGMSGLIEQHQAVVDAVAAGDLEIATESLRAHLRRVFDDITRIRESNPEYFTAPSARERRR